jgi:hypothetical protein
LYCSGVFGSLSDFKSYRNITGEQLMQVRVKENAEEFGKCGCGRSPTGKCIGWHGLNEEQLKEAQRDWDLAEYQKQAQELWNDSCTSARKID